MKVQNTLKTLQWLLKPFLELGVSLLLQETLCSSSSLCSSSMSKSRGFCFTLNNPESTSEPLLKAICCRHLVFGREIAPTTSTPHLQGAIYFPNPRSLKSVIKELAGCHVEIARDYPASITYCKKGGDFWEQGDAPVDQPTRGKRGREATEEMWSLARTAAEAGEFEKIPAGIYLRCKRACHEIAKEHMKPPADLEGVCGLWLYGEPGVGKSRKARQDFPGIFDKPCNKWWDGYQGGPILLDDFDTSHKCLGHHLKRWADRYSFTAETKGGMISIRPPKVVVTSNYSIREIFGEDAILAEAVARRFEQVQMTSLTHPYPNPSPTFTLP